MKKALFGLFFLSLAMWGQNWDFRSGEPHGFRVNNYISFTLKKGLGFLGVGESNAYFSTPWPLELRASSYRYLEVGLTAEETTLTVYFSRTDQAMSEKTRYDGKIDSLKNRVVIDLTSNPEWKGTITALRFDAVRTAGRKANIRYIRLLSQLPVESVTGILPNGDFSGYQEFWSGNAQFSPGNTVIPPRGAIVSEPVELLTVGRYCWMLKSDRPLSTTVEYLDILGNSLGHEAPLRKYCGVIRPPRHAANARLRLTNETAEAVHLQRVAFDYLPGELTAEEAAAILFEGKAITELAGYNNVFQGKWLWLDELKQKENALAVFEKTFEITDFEQLQQAKFMITADNEWEAVMNGHAISGSYSKEWSMADASFVLSCLRPGTNTIRVMVRNIDGPGGFIADLLLKRGGRYTVIGTDDSWRCAVLTALDGWQTVPVTGRPTVLGQNGVNPWGTINYGEPSTLVARLEGLEVPAELDETSVWSPKAVLRFSGEGALNGDLDFSVRFQNEHHDFLVQGCQIPAGATEQTAVIELPLTAASFTYFPAGDYKVVFNLSGVPLEAPTGKTVKVKRKNPATGLRAARLVDKDTVPKIQFEGGEKMSMTQYLIDMGVSDRHYREMKQAFDQGIPAEWIHHIVDFDENGDPDFTKVDNLCISALTRNPEVYFVLITGLDCIRNTSMTKFFRDHPEALVQNEKGESAVRNYSELRQLSPSMASPEWLAEGDRILTRLIEHLAKMPYGQRVAGILPSSGITWEWMYWGCQREGEFVDYSPAFRKAFVAFAHGKYGTIEKANQAWGRDFASFEEIAEKNLLPRPVDRMDSGNPLMLRLPQKDQFVMDFNRCMAVVTSDAIIRFCQTIKRVSGGKLLTGAYYGYYNQIAQSRWAQHSGHWALSRVLASDAVDMLHAPTSYNDRGPGGPAGFMVPDASLRQAGKVFVTESDIRTIYASQSGFGKCLTLGETLAVFVREAAACLSHGVAFRYYDFSNGWVFRDQRFCDMARALMGAEREVSEAKPKIADPANAIAVVVSENGMEHVTYKSTLNAHGIVSQYKQLPQTGVSFASYFTPGLENIPLEHRLWFFENPFKLSAEDYAYIRKNIVVPGNTVIFAMGVDVIQHDRFSAEHMQELTGMAFLTETKKTVSEPVTLTPQGQEFFATKGMVRYDPLPPSLPLFLPVECGDTHILARDRKGTPVLAENTVNGCRVIFTALPGLKADWLRRLAQRTGLHCYNETEGDVTWASGEILGIHCVSAGERKLHAPMRTGMAKELLTGKEYRIRDGVFIYDASRMSSALFLLKRH